MAGEGTDPALVYVPFVRVFPVTMGKREDTCSDKKQDGTERNANTESEKLILGQHEEPGLFLVNRVRLPTSVAI
jgi:hypothetical protein